MDLNRMVKMKHLRITRFYSRQAQAIVEFAIALPILLALLIGIFEVGRLMFIYSAVTNASRNAVRYASVVGLDDGGVYHKYMYCDGIKNKAVKSAFLVPAANLTVAISYDEGPGTGNIVTGGCNASGGDDTDVLAAGVSTGDRVTVTVSAVYKPMVNLVPIKPQTITSSSSRTILGVVNLDP